MQRGQEVGLALAEGKKDDPPRSRFPWRNTTEDRQDDAEADCQPRQGVGQVSCLVCLLLSQPLRVRLCAQSMSKDCSRVCNARTSRPSPWSLANGHALYNVSWNR